MKVEELRIGNWIAAKDYNKPFQVAGQTFLEIIQRRVAGNEVHQPISITDEWLVRFGFDKIQNESYVNGFEFILKPEDGLEFNGIGHYGWLKGDKSLVVNTLCRGNYVCNSVQYVHQLQNLYFALTGKELKANAS